MVSNSIKQKLGNFLGKKTDNVVPHGQTPEGEQVCDLDTGTCYTIRRVENSIRVNRKVQVESPSGEIKQLLNG